jgi:hypothetical protein
MILTVAIELIVPYCFSVGSAVVVCSAQFSRSVDNAGSACSV